LAHLLSHPHLLWNSGLIFTILPLLPTTIKGSLGHFQRATIGKRVSVLFYLNEGIEDMFFNISNYIILGFTILSFMFAYVKLQASSSTKEMLHIGDEIILSVK
jgi:hypothetical protein